VNSALDETYRPDSWDEYVGQRRLKERLRLEIEDALDEGTVPNHIMLAGPSCYGKTTLANLILDEFYDPEPGALSWLIAVMPWKPQDLALASRLNARRVLLVLDEIHALSPRPGGGQEQLLELLDSGVLHLRYEDIKIPNLCVIGCTTEYDSNKLIEPLKNRFKVGPSTGMRFDEYSDEELLELVTSKVARAGFRLDAGVCEQIALIAKGTPRRVDSLVDLARKMAKRGPVTAQDLFAMAQLDSNGLDDMERRYLDQLAKSYPRPIGESALARMLGWTPQAVQTVEAGLYRRSLVRPTDQGRMLTVEGVRLADTLNPQSRPARGVTPGDRNAA
jgi:Holliday junction DNA helicase RuvB